MNENDRLHLVEALRTSGNSLRQLSGMSHEQFSNNYEKISKCLEDMANLLQQAAMLIEQPNDT